MRAHCNKSNISLVSVEQMKRLVNASKYYVLLMVKKKEKYILDAFEVCDPNHRQEFIEIIS